MFGWWPEYLGNYEKSSEDLKLISDSPGLEEKNIEGMLLEQNRISKEESLVWVRLIMEENVAAGLRYSLELDKLRKQRG